MWLWDCAPTPATCPRSWRCPLASGAAWWYWLGGRPSIDLVNTLRERWRRRVETLVTPDDLGLWLVRAGCLPAAAGGDAALACARRASCARRSTSCLQAALAGEPAPAAAVATIDGWLVHAGARPQLALGRRRHARARRARAGRPVARALAARSRSTPRGCSARRPRRRASASAPRRRARRASTTARRPAAGAGARWRCAATRPRRAATASAPGAPPRDVALPLGHPRHGRGRRRRVLGAADGAARARARPCATSSGSASARSASPSRPSRAAGC